VKSITVSQTLPSNGKVQGHCWELSGIVPTTLGL
jgi:hypothetical protein